METPGSRWRGALAVFCAGVLLLAGYVHVGHFCAPPATASRHSFSNADLGSTRVPCLLCISLHAPSLAALTVSMLPGGDSSAATVVRQPVFRSGVQGFALYIRPPPVA